MSALPDVTKTQGAVDVLRRAGFPCEPFSRKRHSGFYVYVLCDPDTKEPFYVGKGTRGRCQDHGRRIFTDPNGAKIDRILDIWVRGQQHLTLIVESDLPEKAAYQLERDLINSIGLQNLTNILPGAVRSAKPAWSQQTRAKRKAKREWTYLFNLVNHYLYRCVTILCELAVMDPDERGRNRHRLEGVKAMWPGLMRDRRQAAERLQSMGYDMPCLR